MRIAVFELDYHIIQLCNFCKLFEESEHELTVFTTKKFYSRVKNDPITSKWKWVLKGEEKISSFIDENLSLINSHDLIFFNTIASGYRTYYKTNFTSYSIIRIHNGHTYLKPFHHLYVPKNFFEFYKCVSYIVREMIPTLDFYYIPKLIDKIDFVCLNDYYREEYAIDKNLISVDKIFPCIPFTTCYSMAKELDPKSSSLSISITGAIDERKRDYELVVNAIKKAMPLLQKPVTLCLLGMPVGRYGKKIIMTLRKLESEKFKMVCFNGFVPQEEFDLNLKGSDLMLAPMIIENQFRIYKEIYGTSKSSGNISDMISFGKMLAVPSSFHNDTEMEKVIDKYDSVDSLASILVNYANDRSLLIKRSKALRDFLVTNYSPKKILADFENNYQAKIGNK